MFGYSAAANCRGLQAKSQTGDSGPCRVGLRRQAVLFAKRTETLLKQLLAVLARLCETAGDRRISQPQHEERLQLRRQLEQWHDHVAAAEAVTCRRDALLSDIPVTSYLLLPSYPVRKIN